MSLAMTLLIKNYIDIDLQLIKNNKPGVDKAKPKVWFKYSL